MSSCVKSNLAKVNTLSQDDTKIIFHFGNMSKNACDIAIYVVYMNQTEKFVHL